MNLVWLQYIEINVLIMNLTGTFSWVFAVRRNSNGWDPLRGHLGKPRDIPYLSSLEIQILQTQTSWMVFGLRKELFPAPYISRKSRNHPLESGQPRSQGEPNGKTTRSSCRSSNPLRTILVASLERNPTGSFRNIQSLEIPFRDPVQAWGSPS